jgi:acetoin utilization deacetylase AcuC-like enzyme
MRRTGNGYERDKLSLALDRDVFVIDAYNPRVYPHDTEAMPAINITIHVTARTSDKQYLCDVHAALIKAIDEFTPDIIYYNAGTGE